MELWLFLVELILLLAPLLNLLVIPLSIFFALTSVSLKKCIFEKTSSGINLNKNPTNKLPAPKATQMRCCERLNGEVSVKLEPTSIIMICAKKMPNIIKKNIGLLQKFRKTFRSFLFNFLLLILLKICIITKEWKNIVKCWASVAL